MTAVIVNVHGTVYTQFVSIKDTRPIHWYECIEALGIEALANFAILAIHIMS